MMIRKVIYGCIVFSFLGCGSHENTEQKKQSQPSKKVNKDTVAKAPKLDLWTSKNIEERLTKYGKEHPNTRAIIKTSMGNIEVKLYEDTPLHRANFVRLANMDFYDSTLFFRIEKNFMIQGGMTDQADSYEREIKQLKAGKYRVPSEINEKYPHVTGALAMANNSYNAKSDEERDYSSDPYNFYIVDGRNITSSTLTKTEREYGLDISEHNKRRYIKEGGTPHLDMQYTVFGHVVKGMDIVNKIAAVPTNESDRPVQDVVILSVEIQ